MLPVHQRTFSGLCCLLGIVLLLCAASVAVGVEKSQDAPTKTTSHKDAAARPDAAKDTEARPTTAPENAAARPDAHKAAEARPDDSTRAKVPHEGSGADSASIAAAPLESLFSPTYQACMDEAAGVTTAIQDCMDAELDRLEKHATDLRARIAPTLSEERATALKEALAAWETLRKHGSAAMFDPDGGSLSPLMASLWYLEQTGRMARWLDSFQENAEP